ncbi:leucine--tRNA ligase [Chlamydiales bacterium]|nr:leucine--tRNA ligase [Chlamydiales bacterium]
MAKYDHRFIERKWQKDWENTKPYKVDVDSSKPKYYILDMFPYPSGAGLHVGHVVGYTATDIISRFKRQKGFNVLHPMGWDSFGLPAEQYAVRTGTHPSITTKKNIDNYRRQLKSLGLSYDWDRELATTDKDYYKWTQWIFTKLYEKGLAYEADMLVNWCPSLGTVLANEEVENGAAKEGGYPVERRPLKQWVLKITAYADRLLEDLDLLDWPEGLKKLQRNWIGKSFGANVDFVESSTNEKITVYTTCHHTLFGVTFMVLAPEHPLVNQITTPEQKEAVTAYQKQVAQESDLYRTELATHKTGVFTGAYAINPVNNEKVPIWIADYVLMGYGTGAVMAVPAHDERDKEFAEKFGFAVKPVIEDEVMCNSSSNLVSIDGLTEEEAKESIVTWLESEKKGARTVNYKLRDWLFSRQRYWGEPFPILHLADGTKRLLEIDELPLSPPEVSDYTPSGDGKSPLAKVTDWVEVIDEKTGQKALRETNTMPQWAGSCWYYLRFIDPKNLKQAWGQEEEKYWMPVDLYVGGAEHAVLHLLYARFWHKVLFDCGYVHTKEPFQRLVNQGLMVSRSFQNSSGLYIDVHDVEEKEGKYYQISTKEELRSQIDKMSKSKLNGVTPDEVIEEFGADSLRLYEMFMGPIDKERVWNTDAVSGSYRFLKRFYEMATSEKITNEMSDSALKLGHRLVDGVTKDIESMQLNTAIAKMMEFINAFTKLDHYPKDVIKMATQCLFPFAPHAASEIWEQLGMNTPIDTYDYPTVNPQLLTDDVITYVVQVNGKLRGRFDFPKDEGESVILEAAKSNPSIQKYFEQGELKKVIFVPNKLLNLVIR